MDLLTVRAEKKDAKICTVSWSFQQNMTPVARGGRLLVRLQGAQDADALAVAELRALYHLLEEREIHGTKRKGYNLTIEQSSGATKKALAKKSLKSMGAGKTDKKHIADAAEFLATRYFRAIINASHKPHMPEFKVFEEATTILEPTRHIARIASPHFDQALGISRHALYRQVGRIDQKLVGKLAEDDLSGVDDARFDAGWDWLVKVLNGPSLREVFVRNDLQNSRRSQRYAGARYFAFSDSEVRAVLVVTKDPSGPVLSTILREQNAVFLQLPGYMVGQQIVPAHVRARNRT